MPNVIKKLANNDNFKVKLLLKEVLFMQKIYIYIKYLKVRHVGKPRSKGYTRIF